MASWVIIYPGLSPSCGHFLNTVRIPGHDLENYRPDTRRAADILDQTQRHAHLEMLPDLDPDSFQVGSCVSEQPNGYKQFRLGSEG